MSNWPLINGGGRYETLGAANTGTTLTSAGSTNALGAWTLIGTTAFGYQAVVLSGVFTSARVMIDIGIGASGSQVVIASQVFYESANHGSAGALLLPLNVPAGVEIWARQRCSSASQTANVNITGMAGEAITPFPAGARLVELLNPSTGSTTLTGTITASGNSANESSWAEIIASTSQTYAALYLQPVMQTDTVRTATAFAIDLAVGAGGSEIEILSNIVGYFETNRQNQSGYAGPFPVNLPSGTRLAARVRCNSAAADSFGVAVLGVVP